MLIEGLCKPPQEKVPLVVKQPRKYYIVSPVDGGRVCDIESAIEAMKVYRESIRDQIEVVQVVQKQDKKDTKFSKIRMK